MRKILFENYSLLKKFVPELTGDIPDFWLNHESKTSQFQNVRAQRLDENLISVGTFYEVNGDLVSDPAISILFDSELKIARVADWTMNNPGMSIMGTAFYEHFDCIIDSAETENEREANDYLNDYLKTFTATRESEQNYFDKMSVNG